VLSIYVYDVQRRPTLVQCNRVISWRMEIIWMLSWGAEEHLNVICAHCGLLLSAFSCWVKYLYPQMTHYWSCGGGWIRICWLAAWIMHLAPWRIACVPIHRVLPWEDQAGRQYGEDSILCFPNVKKISPEPFDYVQYNLFPCDCQMWVDIANCCSPVMWETPVV